MKLSLIKTLVQQLEEVNFLLPDGTFLPKHFHVTEIGLVTKNFIDCGGQIRKEEFCTFQLWEADDYSHRLSPQKLLKIITLSEKTLNIPDIEVEVEYQQNTIGRFGLEFNGVAFVLVEKQTDCLAKDKCGVPYTKEKIKLSQIGQTTNDNCCTPGSACC